MLCVCVGDVMECPFCLPHPVAVSAFMICRALTLSHDSSS